MINYRKKSIDVLWHLLGYNGNKSSTYIFKEIKKYEDDYEGLYKTIMDNASQIEQALERKTFVSEVYKIKYVMAIIANSIEESKLEAEIREAKINAIKTEEGYENLEEVSSSTKQKGKDISSLLGTDDWI